MSGSYQGLILRDRFPCDKRTGDGFSAGLTDAQRSRFYAKIHRADTGCWPWTGSRLPRGYGQFRGPNGPKDIRYAHRLMWELANGRALRAGEVVRHSCDNPPCCNPAHLLIGTQADNIQDAQKQGKYRAAAIQRWAAENPERHALVQSLVHAPRGAVSRAARERGVSFQSLAIAVIRARKRLQQQAEGR
jgi:hypothetical protein